MPHARPRPCPLHTALAALLCAFLAPPAHAQARPAFETTPCFSGSDAQGRGVFPPLCDHGFASHENAVLVETGLPTGVALGGRARLVKLVVTGGSEGGPLGGRLVTFSGSLKLELRGMGGLGRVNSKALVPVTGTFAIAPVDPAADVQSFDFALVSASGALGAVDKDIATLSFEAGSAVALPGEGHAVYTRRPNGEWAVEAWLDLRYRLAFTSVPGGELTGLSGTTQSHLHLLAGRHEDRVQVLADAGQGSIAWPPTTPEGRPAQAMGWFTNQRLAPARALLARMNLRGTPGALLTEGGPLGGELTVGDDVLDLEVVGEGAWAGYRRLVRIPVQTFIHWGPREDHLARQGRSADVHWLYGETVGDPDFALLRVLGGSGFGLPSLGHTTVEQQPGGGFALDSSTDLNYRIEWTGAAGGMFAGLSGNTQAVLRLQSGSEQEGECEAPDDGSGSVVFPPPCVDGFVGEPAVLAALNGLPSGSPLLARVRLQNVNVTGRQPGGVLEGETQGLVADLVLSLQGTGELAGFERTLTLPATAQTMTAPWAKTPGPQHFQTLLQSLNATLPPGDPDFASLSVLGGEVFGFASPGHTTYRPSGPGLWSVDAWIDAGLRVSFTGRAGGALAGFAGQTDTRARLTAGAAPAVLSTPGQGPRSEAPGLQVSAAMPNPTRGPLVVMLHLPRHARVRAAVHDVLGRRVRELEDGERTAGVQSVAWDGRDAAGRRAAPGLYMIRVEADGIRFTRSAIVAH